MFMNNKGVTMNAEIKDAFTRLKPVCDLVMVCPSQQTISNFVAKLAEQPREVIQELQQYILFPFITHIKSTEIEKKFGLQEIMVDAMNMVLEKVTVNNYEMFMKIETGLLDLVFDKSKPGMVAEVPEELKLGTMKCLTVLMCNIGKNYREKFVKTQVPLLAQLVFVAVHIAKLDKLRTLRLAAIHCVMAHTATHPKFTDKHGLLLDADIEPAIADMLASILPGLLAALQDVATCADNPGHSVIVAALRTIHRVVCIPMNDKYLKKPADVTIEDFAKFVQEKISTKDKEVSNDGAGAGAPGGGRTPAWYAMAGSRLTLITSSVVSLRAHHHRKVRAELAVYCARILTLCNKTMQPSIPLVLDVLMSLSHDEHPSVSSYCRATLDTYLLLAPDDLKRSTIDTMMDNMFTTITSLSRILNNIDSGRKLSALDAVCGYLSAACRARGALAGGAGVAGGLRMLCTALVHAATPHAPLTLLTRRMPLDVTQPPVTNSPWMNLKYLDTVECEKRLQEICMILGNADCADLVLDTLLDMLQHNLTPEIVYIINYLGKAPQSSASLARRILDAYLEENVWYLPLEVGSEHELTDEDTLDPTVYNPRAWIKDSVPGLYEGAVEVRYTDISYSIPRPAAASGERCRSMGEAQRNMLVCCLLTEGVGALARRLGEHYQPYLLRTLCLLLERVGSKYEMLHCAGLKAVNDVAAACGLASVRALVGHNADYFTHQVTVRLKKLNQQATLFSYCPSLSNIPRSIVTAGLAVVSYLNVWNFFWTETKSMYLRAFKIKSWDTGSALEILSVVIEYSDSSLLDCLYGIVQDVLLQSCDKYYQKNLEAYLQVFLTFVNCVHKWYPPHIENNIQDKPINVEDIDITVELNDFIEKEKELEILLNEGKAENDIGKSAQEMYLEDMERREDELLDYDDKVTTEGPATPQHINATITILKRCVHFMSSRRQEKVILALQVMERGLPLLAAYEDLLLPLVHASWPALRLSLRRSPPVARRALPLLLTAAALTKDFIKHRAIKEALPHIYSYLDDCASESRLKDAGSAYRNSQHYHLQFVALQALEPLAVDLGLDDDDLEDAMACVDRYLSKEQPKPLQTLAVKFYRRMLVYDAGAARHHLRPAPAPPAPPRTPLRLNPCAPPAPTPGDDYVHNNIIAIFGSDF